MNTFRSDFSKGISFERNQRIIRGYPMVVRVGVLKFRTGISLSTVQIDAKLRNHGKFRLELKKCSLNTKVQRSMTFRALMQNLFD